MVIDSGFVAFRLLLGYTLPQQNDGSKAAAAAKGSEKG